MPDSLEQLDLLLIEEVRSRRIRRDGIHFQGFRYFSLTLAAYVGEDTTIRYDPRDMAEIRVLYRDRFLCRAICAGYQKHPRRKYGPEFLENAPAAVEMWKSPKNGDSAHPHSTTTNPVLH